MFIDNEKACWIPYDKSMRKVRKHIQVFGLSTSQNSITSTTSSYRLLDPRRDNNFKNYLIGAGRMANNEVVYAAVAVIPGRSTLFRRMITVISYVADSSNFAKLLVWDPNKGNQGVQQINTRFHVIGCGTGFRVSPGRDKDKTFFYVKPVQEAWKIYQNRAK